MSNLDEWNPTRADDIALKEALKSLHQSADTVLLSPLQQKEKDEQQKRFLLQGKSYFDLKAYVWTGKDFPVDGNAFNAQYPEKAFARLLPLDQSIYADTKKSLIAVGSSCTAFYEEKLQNIPRAGSLAVTWSTTTLGYLTDNPGINLYKSLMVLSDLKYKSLEDRDEEFHKALVAARGCLKLLENDAANKKKEAEELINHLDKFRDATAALQPDMSALIRKYTAGPQPYLEYLNKEHQKRIAEEGKTLASYNSTVSEWKSATGLAIGIGVSVGWIPIFGWIPLAMLSHNADNLHGAYERLWKSYESLKKENADEALLIKSINSMVLQLNGLENKIQDAIKAVGVLSVMFENQSRSYGLIRDSLSGLGLMANDEDAETRNMFIMSSIEETKKKLEQIRTAAAGFVDAIMTQTSLV